jgi:hypothetical protein
MHVLPKYLCTTLDPRGQDSLNAKFNAGPSHVIFDVDSSKGPIHALLTRSTIPYLPHIPDHTPNTPHTPHNSTDTLQPVSHSLTQSGVTGGSWRWVWMGNRGSGIGGE